MVRGTRSFSEPDSRKDGGKPRETGAFLFCMSAKKQKKKRTSGRNVTEAQRNTIAIKLRMAPDVAAELDVLRGASGRSAFVSALIRAEPARL